MKIGVFDSGIGGKSIAEKLQADYLESEVMYVNDRKNVPYGSRSQQEIIQLTDAAIQPLLMQQCDVIVLACNTATAAAIELLKSRYPDVPFVGLEPMVKPAALLTQSGTIAICATPFTLSSDRYAGLKEKYAGDITVLEPDCSEWAGMIESDQTDIQEIANEINEVCSAGADVIVLACTHYHWIKEEIIKIAAGRAQVIDPSEAISRQVGTVLGVI